MTKNATDYKIPYTLCFETAWAQSVVASACCLKFINHDWNLPIIYNSGLILPYEKQKNTLGHFIDLWNNIFISYISITLYYSLFPLMKNFSALFLICIIVYCINSWFSHTFFLQSGNLCITEATPIYGQMTEILLYSSRTWIFKKMYRFLSITHRNYEDYGDGCYPLELMKLLASNT